MRIHKLVHMKPCPKCYSEQGCITDGTGPHYAALKCRICNTHIKWVSEDRVKLLEGDEYDD